MGIVSSIGTDSTTKQDADDNSSFRLSPLHSAHSNVTSTLPSPTFTHVDATSDAGSGPSFMASFFKKTMHHVRWPSQSPSRETDTSSDTDRQRGDNADTKRKGAELAHPAMSDLKQEGDLDLNHFSS